MNAPKPIQSVEPEWSRANLLAHEADTLKNLLTVLMYHYNSSVDPQRNIYIRVSRIRDKACKRYNRRSIAATVEMYKAINIPVSEDHIFYKEITEALNASNRNHLR